MTQYKTVDTSTLKGLKQAERLHANGWKIAHTGLFLIQFYRYVASKPTKWQRHALARKSA